MAYICNPNIPRVRWKHHGEADQPANLENTSTAETRETLPQQGGERENKIKKAEVGLEMELSDRAFT